MNEYIYLIAPFSGWVVAQTIKFVLTLRKDGIRLSDAVQSGGMPSSHAAFMAALTTVIGLELGATDPIFGLAVAATAIVLYDAAGVRQTTGQQTQAIKELAKGQSNKLKSSIQDARGHTIVEVAAGVLVGVVTGLTLNTVL